MSLTPCMLCCDVYSSNAQGMAFAISLPAATKMSVYQSTIPRMEFLCLPTYCHYPRWTAEQCHVSCCFCFLCAHHVLQIFLQPPATEASFSKWAQKWPTAPCKTPLPWC